MLYRILITNLIIASFLVSGCSPEQSSKEKVTKSFEEEVIKSKKKAYTIKEESLINDSNDLIAQYFTPSEIETIRQIKEVYDNGLRGQSEKAIASLYAEHALRMRLDLFNNYPYTLNYPYNGKFDLSMAVIDMDKLSFLSYSCGFMDKNDKKINHYCFKDDSNFMRFMESLGKDNALIAMLYEDYLSKKTISPAAKQGLVMGSEEKLNFDKQEHQLVYMFYQILVNEERLAVNKISS